MKFFFIFFGFILILNSSFISITGNVVGNEGFNIGGSILGLIFVVAGIALMIGEPARKLETMVEVDDENQKEKYYPKRVKEIFDTKYNGQDAWVSRWELDGLLYQIKNGLTGDGKKIYTKTEIEHGKERPAIHLLGQHKHPHLHVSLTDKYGRRIKRHLLISEDPYDSRIKNIGIGNSERIKSKIYSPNHPRSKEKEYKRGIDITFEKDKV